MNTVLGIMHVVSDLNQMIAFYTQVLEFTEVQRYELPAASFDALFQLPQSQATVVQLSLGKQYHYLIGFSPKHPEAYIEDSCSHDLWFQHIAIVVSDIERAHEKLMRHGISSISNLPQTIPDWNVAAAGIKAFYFRSPDGHPLELICFPPKKGAEIWQKRKGLFLGIDHTALAVANTEESLKFYQDFLGMQIVGGSLNYGKTQEMLSGVPGAKVKITNLQFPGSKGMGIELLEYITPFGGRKKPSNISSHHPIEMTTLIAVDDLSKFGKQPMSLQGMILFDPDGHRIFLVEGASCDTKPFS
jgi:catechol 2,3-dioxygenase-like lactoylglutathione lyase family enzyme